MAETKMIDVALTRIVIRDDVESQHIVLSEREGTRGFTIVIGDNEAQEIQRIVHGQRTARPLTHQLTFEAIQALGARIRTVDIVDLKQNTFYARIVLDAESQGEAKEIDARPSDAIALALRAGCQIRVAEGVLDRANSENA